jgi:hypothetical protein
MQVLQDTYMKLIHGGHKVEKKDDIFLIDQQSINTKEFKKKFGKLPELYFEIKVPDYLIGLVSIFDIKPNTPKPKLNRKLGVDVEAKIDDIKSIFYKHFAKMCIQSKYDPEEMLQEIYLGILHRNKGNCPYDPAKSSLSTYIVMVSRCILFNIFNKENKTRSKIYDPQEKDDLFRLIKDNHDFDSKFLIEEARNLCKTEDMKKVFDQMLLGYNISQISNNLKIENRKVSEMSNKIKRTISPLLMVNKDF